MTRRNAFRFRLYVAGDSLNALQASANLSALCEARLQGRHQIEIIDVYRDPRRALADGIRLTPTLVKVAPGPERRIVGTLSEAETVLLTLGITVSGD